MRALSNLPADELVVQYGASAPPAGVREAVDYLPRPELLERMEAADVVVTHAGVGSILTARRCGHTPLVVPRRHSLGEHVDDHQVELTEALASYERVVAVWDTDELAAQVAAARGRPRLADEPELRATSLHRAVQAALLGG